ncbi:hypothetical protein L916_02687 [Phytophthora nicotianae]|uniref:Uncharacterized protein n=1 Tax=Phytophthora nicotianae TaxID=4792 RepID=W2JMF2_PHYNI|nr:hypothetical protein L916_02687 [Phytophthora nicotianae]
MWCFFERQNAVTLGKNTNNRIEASWRKLTELVNGFMGVDECIAAIMCHQAQAEREYMEALYSLSVVHNPKYDREMQFLSNMVSEHACEPIYDQYDYALMRANFSFYEPVPDIVLIQNVCDEGNALDEPRWLLASLRSDSEMDMITSEPFAVGHGLKESSTVWDSNRKFR